MLDTLIYLFLIQRLVVSIKCNETTGSVWNENSLQSADVDDGLLGDWETNVLEITNEIENNFENWSKEMRNFIEAKLEELNAKDSAEPSPGSTEISNESDREIIVDDEVELSEVAEKTHISEPAEETTMQTVENDDHKGESTEFDSQSLDGTPKPTRCRKRKLEKGAPMSVKKKRTMPHASYRSITNLDDLINVLQLSKKIMDKRARKKNLVQILSFWKHVCYFGIHGMLKETTRSGVHYEESFVTKDHILEIFRYFAEYTNFKKIIPDSPKFGMYFIKIMFNTLNQGIDGKKKAREEAGTNSCRYLHFSFKSCDAKFLKQKVRIGSDNTKEPEQHPFEAVYCSRKMDPDIFLEEYEEHGKNVLRTIMNSFRMYGVKAFRYVDKKTSVYRGLDNYISIYRIGSSPEDDAVSITQVWGCGIKSVKKAVTGGFPSLFGLRYYTVSLQILFSKYADELQRLLEENPCLHLTLRIEKVYPTENLLNPAAWNKHTQIEKLKNFFQHTPRISFEFSADEHPYMIENVFTLRFLLENVSDIALFWSPKESTIESCLKYLKILRKYLKKGYNIRKATFIFAYDKDLRSNIQTALHMFMDKNTLSTDPSAENHLLHTATESLARMMGRTSLIMNQDMSTYDFAKMMPMIHLIFKKRNSQIEVSDEGR